MRTTRVLQALLFLAASLLSHAQQPDRIAARPDLASLTPLPNHRPSWAVANNDRGTIPDATPIHLIVALSRSPQLQAAFDQRLSDQQNLASSHYHQWLTPAQIGEQFGPTQHDLQAVTAWLTSRGFTVEGVTPSRTFIQATATAASVAAAFRTSLHTYALGDRTVQAPSSDPVLPAALVPVISYISGLTQTPFHTSLHQTAPIPLEQTPLSPHYTLSNGSVHLLAPADFAVAYNLNPAYTAGITGTGQRVAIIGGSRLLPSDLTSWESLSGLPSAQPTYIVPTGTGFADPGVTSNGDQSEGTLDFERVYGTAPGSSVDQIISTNWLNGTTTENLILYAINTVRDPILSLSFGACEAQQTPAYVNYESSVFAQAAAQGIGVFVSSGDAGAAGCEAQGAPPATQTASISDLCASPYVTCVGGTQFSDLTSTAAYWSSTNNAANHSSILSYIPEGAWNEPTGSTPAAPFVVSASGGGRSTLIAKPTYQTGIGVPADTFRDVPDISFSASTHNGYFACLAFQNADCSKSLVAFGGTSASAPSMAGVAALLNQRLGAAQGNLNPLLYRLSAATPAVFHDATPATSGVASCNTSTPSTCNNSTPSAAALTGGLAGYPLTTGYDQVTGLGSLDVSAFITAASGPTPTLTITPSPASLSITAGASSNNTITLTYNATNLPNGTFTQTCTVTGVNSFYPPSCLNFANSITLNGNTATTTFSISSIARAAAVPTPLKAALPLTSVLLLLLIPATLRRNLRVRTAFLAVLLLATLTTLSACGSGNGATTITPVSGSTPAGSYLITITTSSPAATVTIPLTIN